VAGFVFSLTLSFALLGAVVTMAETEEEVPKPLLLMGKMFPLDLVGGELTMNGQPIFIQEVPNAGSGTGANVWDGVCPS
jgi:hypothetical protein